jgi:tRNA (guanosine-2'-O-)-methyltransferase
VDVLSDYEQRLQAYLEGFITPERRERMLKVLEQRTRYVTCVLEDLFDPRNGSAVIRHCDALGIHELHAIENRNPFRSDEQVDLGTAQWLDLRIYRKPQGIKDSVKALRRTAAGTPLSGGVTSSAAAPDQLPAQARYSGTPEVLAGLKNRGYRIVATSPHGDDDALPETLSLNDGPVAVVFGTEKHGISSHVKDAADLFLRIPMVGFVESFNLSASAAIIFHVLSRRLRSEKLPWQLDDEDARRVMFEWVCRTAPHAKSLIRRFEEENS